MPLIATHAGKAEARRNLITHARTAIADRPIQSALTIGLLFLALFMLVRPYQGIRHDAILYTAQALHDAHPENFRSDLFFAFGSQDKWTLYGTLYGKLIALIGIRAANLSGLVLAHLLWWTGIWRLSQRLLPAPWRWIAVLFVVAMPADYGANFSFFYAEPWLTARVPAEGLCLWALAFALDRRPAYAFALALASMTLHPLNGAVGFAAVLMVVASRLPWWRIFAGLLLAFAALQIATPAGFAIHPLDSAWREVLETEIDYLFPSQWSLFAWSKAAWVIALPLILHAGEPPAQQRLWGRLALIGIAGMVCATLADIVGHDALWIQLQMWRVLWLLSVMQWLALPALITREWHRRPALLWWLALCWLTLEVGGGVVAFAIALLCNARPLLQGHADKLDRLAGSGGIGARYKPWLLALTLPALIVWVLAQLAFGIHQASSLPSSTVLQPVAIIVHSRFMAPVVGMLCALLLMKGRTAHGVFYALLVGLLAYGAINIDQRAPTIKIMESRLDDPARAPFAGRVAPGQLVYWDGPWHELVYPWILMRTASYFSPAQASGIVFHRQTTFEALRRASVIGGPAGDAAAAAARRAAAGPAADSVPVQGHPNAGEEVLLARRQDLFTPMDADGIRRVCSDAAIGIAPDQGKSTDRDADLRGAAPPDTTVQAAAASGATYRRPIDFVVSAKRYATLPISGQWDVSRTQQYWLYDCKQIDGITPSAHTSRGG